MMFRRVESIRLRLPSIWLRLWAMPLMSTGLAVGSLNGSSQRDASKPEKDACRNGDCESANGTHDMSP